MNPSLMLLGVFAVSVIVASYLAYKIKSRSTDPQGMNDESYRLLTSSNSSIEDDFRDLLEHVSIDRINEILHDYLMYDKQIANTYSFIDDQIKFISPELNALPHTGLILNYLRDMGLRIEYWRSLTTRYWKNLPKYKRAEPDIASGGLTVMIRKIMRSLPIEDLHVLLSWKARSSENFRILIILLGSPIFLDMCEHISKNNVLRRHYHWALEADIEATFAIELFYALHSYLTRGLV